MNVTINWQTIITIASLITAIVLIVKSIKKGMNYAEKPSKNEEAIKELYSMVEEQRKTDEALAKGMQALLRASMVKDFNHYSGKGFAPIYARETFRSCYDNYHALGGNGVMTDIYNKFLALPTEEQNEKEN